MRVSESGRIALNQSAKAAVREMLKALEARDACIKIDSSKLVSWIVEKYLAIGFEKDQPQIVQAHFNSKEYLKRAMANAASDEELVKALSETLSKIGNVPRRMPKATMKNVHKTASDDEVS